MPSFLLNAIKDALPPSLFTLVSLDPISQEGLKLLLKHDLLDPSIRRRNIVEFFFSLDFIDLFNGHFALGFNPVNITSVCGLKVRVRKEVVHVDELVLACL